MDPPSENTESHDAPADGGPAKRKRTASPDGGDRNMISPDVMKAVISATGSAVAAAIHSSQMEQQRVVEKADAESAQHAADLIGYDAQLKAKDKEMSDLGVKLTKQCSLSDELKRDTEAKDKEIAGLREEMKRVKEMSGSKDKELAGLQAAEVQLQEELALIRKERDESYIRNKALVQLSQFDGGAVMSAREKINELNETMLKMQSGFEKEKKKMEEEASQSSVWKRVLRNNCSA